MAKKITAVSKKRTAAKALTPGQKAAKKKAMPIMVNGQQTTIQQQAALKAAATRRINKLGTHAAAAAIPAEVVRSAPITAAAKLESALKLAKLLISNGLV